MKNIALKRNSTRRKHFRERIYGERFLCGNFGTYLGALYESIAYACVKGCVMWISHSQSESDYD